MADLIRVLLVEDSAADAQMTSDMLVFARAPRCELRRAERLDEAQALLAAERFDIVLLDLGLPDATGLDGVRALRAAAPQTAIIVLSGIGSEALAVEALEGGAQDYLVKGRGGDDALQRSMRFAIARREADRAARSLRAAEEHFRVAFDEAPIGMMIIDLEARYASVNDAFCAIVGHSRQTLVGMSRESVTHPDDVAADSEALRSLLAGDVKTYTRDKRYIHAAGHPVWASISVTLIRDADGHPLHFIAQTQDITERRTYEGQLKHMADHDPLTGLLNRRSFERELTGHIARVKRLGMAGAVLMLDLDNFKYYNDTEGHSAGDGLIVRIAQALRSRLRESDVIARLGGDEFAVLLPRESEDGAQVVARALLETVRAEAPEAKLGNRRRVTASVGIACFEDGLVTADEIMVNADLAMYDAKEHGRDRVAHYRTDQHQRPRIESQMKWATQITQALAEDRFALVAQPIVPLAGNGPAQYELLLRMCDAHGDLIPPGTFLYIAERLGLICEIDRWVAARAIDILAENRNAGHDLRLEVNLSGRTIGDAELLELIERRLHETGVPADRLIFEITETAAVANIARAATFAERLAELGCKFALDDFGAGFGSFYYLKHLPFDYLKIDGEYVRHCATNETDRILIAAVVQIARGMGKQTIAEFVADQETVAVLTRLGVDYGQGYFLGRPEPLAFPTPVPGQAWRAPAFPGRPPTTAQPWTSAGSVEAAMPTSRLRLVSRAAQTTEPTA
jgi:diguanylate cyclase (GGDEF)-like protein/PAS domain S-box-containing protein